jgi:Tfp pilus assembly protein PilO
MERPDRNEKDDTQKAKLIFISLAVVVIIILAWSFVSANNARKERDAARQETEMLKQDSVKLEQLLREQNVMIDDLKKKVQLLEAKAKAKPVAKKKSAPAKTTAKKSTKSKKSQ